jgi:hypothetical protein
MLLDELMQDFTSSVINDLKSSLAIPLRCTGNDNLVAFIAMPNILTLATYPCLVNLDNLAQGDRVINCHGLSDSVAKKPGGFIGDPDGALDLISGDSLFRFNHQVNCSKPLPQRKVAIVKNSIRGHGELIAT